MVRKNLKVFLDAKFERIFFMSNKASKLPESSQKAENTFQTISMHWNAHKIEKYWIFKFSNTYDIFLDIICFYILKKFEKYTSDFPIFRFSESFWWMESAGKILLKFKLFHLFPSIPQMFCYKNWFSAQKLVLSQLFYYFCMSVNNYIEILNK